MNESNQDQSASISKIGLNCQERFTALIHTLRRTDDGGPNDLSNVIEAVEEELGRFRTWANNIGAVSSGRGSLDYRVRAADFLRQNVKSLLKDLEASLEEGSSLAYKSDMIATLVTSGEIDESSSTSSSSTDSQGDSRSMMPRSFRAYYTEVASIIDKLFQLSIFMRGTGRARKFRMTRAAAYVERDQEGNDVLPEFRTFVEFMIKNLRPSSPEPWLVNRLAEVIAMRRQQFYYQRAHKKNMSHKSESPQEETPIEINQQDTDIMQANRVKRTKTRSSLVKSETPGARGQSAKSKTNETAATELQATNERRPVESRVQAGPTKTEIAGRHVFPGPPKTPEGKDFECYQCFYIQPASVRKDELWKFFHRA